MCLHRIFSLNRAIFASLSPESASKDPIAEMFYNSIYGELYIKFKSSDKIYVYDVPEEIERRIRFFRNKKNYSKMIKILQALKSKATK